MGNGVRTVTAVVGRDVKNGLQRFKDLRDPRLPLNMLHPLDSVVVIAIMAVLAGAHGPAAIAKWANIKSQFLLTLLDLPHGIPQKGVFRRVLATLKPDAFHACFTMWLAALYAADAIATGTDRPTYADDGKPLRRSQNRKKELGAQYSVSLWASECGFTFAQAATQDKSNEVTAIPQPFSLVDINGAIVTIDALGAQTAIAAKIVDGGGDFVLALKGKQESLYQATMKYISKQGETDFQRIGTRRRVIAAETKHGRTETRTYIQMPAPRSLPGYERWKGLLSIGVVTRQCIGDGKESTDSRYFITSLPVNVKQFAHAVRSPWEIENSYHWCFDVTYCENQLRIRDEHFRESFAWLNRITLSLLRRHFGEDGVAIRRRCGGENAEFVLAILTGEYR
jgi:predicted transposase YbfD/YdcC